MWEFLERLIVIAIPRIRDFLLEIRNHQYEYDELIYKLEEKVKEMDEAVKQTSLPDKIDINRVNDLLLQIRKTQLQL